MLINLFVASLIRSNSYSMRLQLNAISLRNRVSISWLIVVTSRGLQIDLAQILWLSDLNGIKWWLIVSWLNTQDRTAAGVWVLRDNRVATCHICIYSVFDWWWLRKIVGHTTNDDRPTRQVSKITPMMMMIMTTVIIMLMMMMGVFTTTKRLLKLDAHVIHSDNSPYDIFATNVENKLQTKKTNRTLCGINSSSSSDKTHIESTLVHLHTSGHISIYCILLESVITLGGRRSAVYSYVPRQSHWVENKKNIVIQNGIHFKITSSQKNDDRL